MRTSACFLSKNEIEISLGFIDKDVKMTSSKLIISSLLSIALSSCATVSENNSKPPQYKMTVPTAVSLFTRHPNLSQHYTVIGTATVSRLNQVGIKRQKAIINDHLREIAAEMGGDAIINLSSTPQNVSGLVIVFNNRKLSSAVPAISGS